jgi:hypothetical protein
VTQIKLRYRAENVVYGQHCASIDSEGVACFERGIQLHAESMTFEPSSGCLNRCPQEPQAWSPCGRKEQGWSKAAASCSRDIKLCRLIKRSSGDSAAGRRRSEPAAGGRAARLGRRRSAVGSRRSSRTAAPLRAEFFAKKPALNAGAPAPTDDLSQKQTSQL